MEVESTWLFKRRYFNKNSELWAYKRYTILLSFFLCTQGNGGKQLCRIILLKSGHLEVNQILTPFNSISADPQAL